MGRYTQPTHETMPASYSWKQAGKYLPTAVHMYAFKHLILL